MMRLQLEPSAHAPCTNTIVGFRCEESALANVGTVITVIASTMTANLEKASPLNTRHPQPCGRGANCFGGGFDQIHHLDWMRHHRHMTCGNLHGAGAHSPSEHPLCVGRNCLVVRGH